MSGFAELHLPVASHRSRAARLSHEHAKSSHALSMGDQLATSLPTRSTFALSFRLFS